MRPLLQSGDWRNAPCGDQERRGFTLIEIMVVIAIMALVLTIGVPAIYQARHRQALSQAVEDLKEACNLARGRAILQGVTTELHLFPQDRRIVVADVTPDMAAGVVGAQVPAAPSGGDKPAGFSRQWSNHLMVRMVDVNFVEYKDEVEARVRFFPNGTSDELTMILESLDNGEKREITVELVTALAESRGYR